MRNTKCLITALLFGHKHTNMLTSCFLLAVFFHSYLSSWTVFVAELTVGRGGAVRGVWHCWAKEELERMGWTRWWTRDYCWSLVGMELGCDPERRGERNFVLWIGQFNFLFLSLLLLSKHNTQFLDSCSTFKGQLGFHCFHYFMKAIRLTELIHQNELYADFIILKAVENIIVLAISWEHWAVYIKDVPLLTRTTLIIFVFISQSLCSSCSFKFL